MATFPRPDQDAYLGPATNLWSENPFAMPFNYLQQTQARRGLGQYRADLQDSIASQAQAEQLASQAELFGAVGEHIVGMRDRDPGAAVLSREWLDQAAPGVFSAPAPGMQNLLAQEATGFAGRPGAQNFEDVGAGAASFADAGLVFPHGPSANDLMLGDQQSLWGMTPAESADIAVRGAAANGASRDQVTIGSWLLGGQATSPQVTVRSSDPARGTALYDSTVRGLTGHSGVGPAPAPVGLHDAPDPIQQWARAQATADRGQLLGVELQPDGTFGILVLKPNRRDARWYQLDPETMRVIDIQDQDDYETRRE